mgnify:CR=1 FL=1
MENYNKAEILQMVEEEDVEFIRLQFTDMFGVLKNVAIPASRIIKAMHHRPGVAGWICAAGRNRFISETGFGYLFYPAVAPPAGKSGPVSL